MWFLNGADDVDTRAITRRLREDGSLIGVLSTEESKTDNELIQMARRWNIVGRFEYILIHALVNLALILASYPSFFWINVLMNFSLFLGA